MTRVVDIVNGHPVTDAATIDGPAALIRKREVEKRLGEIKALMDSRRGGASELYAEREALKAENTALDTRMRAWREQQKKEGSRRNFAGLDSPLFEAVKERFPPEVARELELDALRRFDERLARKAEEKAAKAAPASGMPATSEKRS